MDRFGGGGRARASSASSDMGRDSYTYDGGGGGRAGRQRSETESHALLGRGHDRDDEYVDGKRVIRYQSEGLEKLNKRTTTDICCCFVFVLFWIGIIMVVYSSVKKGDPRRLYHGLDYKGRLCGIDKGVEGMNLIYWPRASMLRYPVCVTTCPRDKTETVLFPVEKMSASKAIIAADNTVRIITTIESSEDYIPTYASRKVAGRFCLPDRFGRRYNMTKAIVEQEKESPLAILKDTWMDLQNAWGILLAMIPLSISLGYAYLFLLRNCAKCMTWGVIIGMLGTVGFLAYYFLSLSRDPKMAEGIIGNMVDDPAYWCKILGYIFCAVTFLFLLATGCFFRTVQNVVGCIEASCEAMWALPLLLLMPLLEIIVKCVIVILWLFLLTWVITNGTIEAPTARINGQNFHGLVKHFFYTDAQKFGIVAYIYSLAWALETMTTFFQFIIAFAVSTWYFTPRNSDGSKVSFAGVAHGAKGIAIIHTAVFYAVRYHMGSLALGAAIVATFRFARWILECIAAQTKATQNKTASTIAECCITCIWCFEQIIRYINKNAIISLVLESKNFFSSAGRAIALLATSTEAAALNGVTFIFQCIGCAAITGISALAAAGLLENLTMYTEPASDTYLDDKVAVIAVAALIAAFIAAAFMFIFDLVSDTLLYCWLVDSKDGRTECCPRCLENLVASTKGTDKDDP